MKDRIERLKKIKEEAGVSLEQLAPRVGMSVYTISRWFNATLLSPHQASVKVLDIFFTEYEEAKKKGTVKELFGKS